MPSRAPRTSRTPGRPARPSPTCGRRGRVDDRGEPEPARLGDDLGPAASPHAGADLDDREARHGERRVVRAGTPAPLGGERGAGGQRVEAGAHCADLVSLCERRPRGAAGRSRRRPAAGAAPPERAAAGRDRDRRRPQRPQTAARRRGPGRARGRRTAGTEGSRPRGRGLPGTGASRSPSSTCTRSSTPASIAFSRARITDQAHVSIAHTSARESRAIAIAIAPDPVPTSATRAGSSPMRASAVATTASVAGRGVIDEAGQDAQLRAGEENVVHQSCLCTRPSRSCALTAEPAATAVTSSSSHGVKPSVCCLTFAMRSRNSASSSRRGSSRHRPRGRS